ncbi:21244_t:CDS:1 [Cetraspora pellucida]|uniref:21244_t:CDS:1 n=1 Tax=Cetraspora pellucida TaxID=1433469 RepID=A0A9N8VVL2_9GLOM|nr:21244_t:CDS:1 [Cetraspora pellucida]
MDSEYLAQPSKISIDIHVFQELIQYKEDALKLEFEKNQYILEINNLNHIIENLNNNIIAIQYKNSIEISELKNYYEPGIFNLKNKYNEILQNNKSEISNLKNYYENEIINLKTNYETEILNLKNYNKSEIFKLKDDYNQSKNDYNIKIINLKNKIFSLEQELKNPSIDLFSNFFEENINNLSNLLCKKQYEEKCFPPTDSFEFMNMIDSFNLKPFVLIFFNIFKSNINQSSKSIEKLKIRIMLLMYHLAGLKNNKITNVKNSIGSFFT